MLFHVWFNVIGNAVKFSPVSACVRVAMRAEEGKIAVQIEDHGCGIGAEALPHIFEKFYQEDASHATDGNGLGLALVKRILTLCGGEISVRSRPGEGSVFTVTLPV